MDKAQHVVHGISPAAALSGVKPDDLYDVKTAAQLLGISRTTLWTLRRTGQIQSVPILGQMVRFRGRHLLAFIERCEKNARRTMRQRRAARV